MHNAYVVTGMLTDGRTVTLDESLPLPSTKVNVVVEPLLQRTEPPYPEVLTEIRRRQRARGHQPPTREAVDALVHAERESWRD